MRRPTPTSHLVLALLLGFACVAGGVRVAMDARGPDEFGVTLPPQKLSYVWIAIGSAILITATYLLIRRLRK